MRMRLIKHILKHLSRPIVFNQKGEKSQEGRTRLEGEINRDRMVDHIQTPLPIVISGDFVNLRSKYYINIYRL